MIIKQVTGADSKINNEILNVWESAVRATHDFLSGKDIEELRPLVRGALPEVEKLYCAFDAGGRICGFMGLNGDKLEMLFISPEFFGKGLGKQFAQYAVNELKVRFVDVNEQNAKAAGFYGHMGFKTFKRSAQDAQGKPFPILHMKIGEHNG
jgi:putative acetyltransferase